MPELTIWFD